MSFFKKFFGKDKEENNNVEHQEQIGIEQDFVKDHELDDEQGEDNQ